MQGHRDEEAKVRAVRIVQVDAFTSEPFRGNPAGVAHCCLAPFWEARLGRDEMVGRQLSRRGGIVKVRARGDRVDILGQAVTVMRGEIVGASGQD